MGYTTRFEGVLTFAHELTVPQVAALTAMFEEDCREHPEWGAPGLSYLDMEFNEDFTGIRHNGAEKTYEFDKLVNVVINVMRKTWPEFGLAGQLLAQGEETRDRWALVIAQDGMAIKRDIKLTGKVVRCPHCEEEFQLEETNAKL